MHWIALAFSLAFAKAGRSIAARIAIIAITTSNSIKVNPIINLRFRISLHFLLGAGIHTDSGSHTRVWLLLLPFPRRHLRSEDNFLAFGRRAVVVGYKQQVITTDRSSGQHRRGDAEDISADVGERQF